MDQQSVQGGACRVVLTDDHTIVRHAIRTIIENSGEFKVVGQAENSDEAISTVGSLKPDILILDIALPGKSGIETIYELHQQNLRPHIVMLTMYEDEDKVVQAMAAGAKAYILKKSSAQEFMEALQAVRRGQIFLPKRFQHLRDQISKAEASGAAGIVPDLRPDPLSRLSKREREIFYLLADGMPNRVIAKKLFISPRTVETHRARVLKKFSFNSTADLIRYAIRNNLLTL